MTLQDLRTEIQRLARLIGATDDDLPTFGASADMGRRHVEVTGRGFESVYELQHRVPGQDSRRVRFASHVELLTKLSTAWGRGRRTTTPRSSKGIPSTTPRTIA